MIQKALADAKSKQVHHQNAHTRPLDRLLIVKAVWVYLKTKERWV